MSRLPLDNGLIDQLQRWLHPQLVGPSDAADPLYRPGTTATFELTDSRVLSNGIILATVTSPGAVAVLATVDHRVSMPEPRIEIVYCTQCRWLPRAAWLAQELLTTFEPDLGEVALVPGAGGVFVVRVDGELVWDRRDQGFPEPVAVKNAVRDRIAPGRDLGHADRPPP